MSRIIWAPPSQHLIVWKHPPEILLTALGPRNILAWREKNSWADNIDLIVFTDETPPRGAFRCRRFAKATGECPHIVVNPPPGAMLELDTLASLPMSPAHAYVAAVATVGRSLAGKRCGWLQPESDHSTGACVLAETVGMVLALAQTRMMDSIGIQMAGRLGVDVHTLGAISPTVGDV